MITRRQVLIGAGAAAAATFGLGGYAFGVEPMLRLAVTDYSLTPPGWPADFPLTIAVLADIHAIDPWMTPGRIRSIANFTNTLGADLILLAGDYESNMLHRLHLHDRVPMTACADALSVLHAPVGVYAVLGNHDMVVQGGRRVRKAFPPRGLPILENKAVRLEKDGRPFWLLGLADQLGDEDMEDHGLDDLPGTLAQVGDDAPALLLAHEPDIFPRVPERVALTICGHTHGGQVRLPGIGPLIVPSRYGRRFAYGHIVEENRHLIVSGGLGMSGLPVRFGMPPEVVTIRLANKAVA